MNEGVLTIKAEKTAGCPPREIQIEGLEKDEALRVYEAMAVQFLRTTAGAITITWQDAA